MSQENVDLVKGAYDDFNGGNVDAMLGRLADDVEWTEPGGGNSPSGTFKGRESVGKDVMATVPEQFEEFSCTVSDAKDEGDNVIVNAHFKGKSKSGTELDTTAEHVWEVRDGKVAKMSNSVADADAWAAAWS